MIKYILTAEKKQNIDQDSKKMTLTTTKPVDLDRSIECAACEAFAAVFDDHINNNSLNIDDIDMIELCDEVEIIHKDQVSTIFIVIIFAGITTYSI